LCVRVPSPTQPCSDCAREAAISHRKQEKTLQEIFGHPISGNIDWRRVEHLFESLGAEVTETSHSRIKVRLNGQEQTFTRPHHKDVASRDEIMEIRHFLEAAGAAPAS
jgi:hypothetical protein